MRVNHFESLKALGYSHIIPIIPPEAKLSDKSHIKENDRGKVPGRLNGHDTWTGFPAWQDYEAQDEDIKAWARWGAGVGIVCGEVIAFDIDVLNDELADELSKWLRNCIGEAPIRIGRKPKQLLLYRCTEPVGKRKFRFKLDDGTEHAVELLGKGQQFVAHGVHPGTKRPYHWSNVNGRSLPPISSLVELTPNMVADIWESLANKIKELGGKPVAATSSSAGDRRLIGDDSKVGDPEALKRALEYLPNKMDYDSWIRMCAAIKAGFGGDEAHYPAFEAWCLKYEDNTAEDVRRRWDSIRNSDLGANYVLDMARGHGYNDAVDQFEATEDAEAPELGVDRSRAAAINAMFERYIWVEELKRFADTQTGRLLDEKQFNMRLAKIGNPASSKTCAAMVYTREENRRRTVWGITYRPGGQLLEEEPYGMAFNTWRAADLKLPEIAMDQDVALWLELVRHVIPDEQARGIILDWAAYALQYPSEKCNWAVLVGSNTQGIGKDMMFQPLIAGLGKHNVKYAGPADIASGYTDWAAGVKLIVIEEMHAFERKETMNKLKAFIAAPPMEIRINQKYMPQYQVPNIGAYLFFSNLSNALAIEKEDRRFYVYWSSARRAETGIYARVANWYEQGGMAKVVRYLLQRDLTNFDAKGPAPASQAKEDMRRSSQSALEEWVEHCIEDCIAPFNTDLVVLDDILARIPARLERSRPSRQQLMTILKSHGATNFPRTRLGRVLGSTSSDRAAMYAVRNHYYCENLSREKLVEHFWEQYDSEAVSDDDIF